MMRQKLALVVRGSPDLALRRMNGFPPVRTTRLGSAAMGHLLLLALTLARAPVADILTIEGHQFFGIFRQRGPLRNRPGSEQNACTATVIWMPRWRRERSVRKRRPVFAPSSPGDRRRRRSTRSTSG